MHTAVGIKATACMYGGAMSVNQQKKQVDICFS